MADLTLDLIPFDAARTNAVQIQGVAVSATAPVAGAVLRASSATAAAWSTLTVPDTLASGALLYASSANVGAALVVGAARKVLQVNAGGTAPEWTDALSVATVTATTFTGALVGNASTATALATARLINGVAFNGSADITVTAAAGTLSGATLAAGVTASSLTSVGTLTSLTLSGALSGATTGAFSSNVTVGGTLAVTGTSTLIGASTVRDALAVDRTIENTRDAQLKAAFQSGVAAAMIYEQMTRSGFHGVQGSESLAMDVYDVTGALKILDVTARTIANITRIDTGVAVLAGNSVAVSASQVSLGGITRTTIGANGAASALTALPLGYIDVYVAGVAAQIPYYSRGA